jgi:hypothetical protein
MEHGAVPNVVEEEEVVLASMQASYHLMQTLLRYSHCHCVGIGRFAMKALNDPLAMTRPTLALLTLVWTRTTLREPRGGDARGSELEVRDTVSLVGEVSHTTVALQFL